MAKGTERKEERVKSLSEEEKREVLLQVIINGVFHLIKINRPYYNCLIF